MQMLVVGIGALGGTIAAREIDVIAPGIREIRRSAQGK